MCQTESIKHLVCSSIPILEDKTYDAQAKLGAILPLIDQLLDTKTANAHCLVANDNGEHGHCSQRLADALVEEIATLKGGDPRPLNLVVACSATRLLAGPAVFFGSSPGRKAYPWPVQRATKDELRKVVQCLGSLVQDEDATSGAFALFGALSSDMLLTLRAGAFLGASQIAFRDEEVCQIIVDDGAGIAEACHVLCKFAADPEALNSRPVQLLVTAAACFLGVVLMLSPQSKDFGGSVLERQSAMATIRLLEALAPMATSENCLATHCLYQTAFCTQVLGGASSHLQKALANSSTHEILDMLMSCRATFGDFAPSARAALAMAAIFEQKATELELQAPVHVDFEIACRVSDALAMSLSDNTPITPWLIARDISKLAGSPYNNSSLHAAGVSKYLCTGVQKTGDVNLALTTSQTAVLTERWCARALVSLCMDNSSDLPSWIPNACTCAALLCGFYASLLGGSGRIGQASVAILLALVFDLMDGKLVRVVGSRSQFGSEYDTLSDMVAFGVAPALLMYHALLEGLGALGLVTSCCYIVAAGVRHSQYATCHSSAHFVSGLPSNVAALLMVGAATAFPNLGWAPSTASAAGALLSLLSSAGMIATFRQRNFLPDLSLRQSSMALVIIGSVALLSTLLPAQRVMFTAVLCWAAAVFSLREQKEFITALTLVVAGLAGALALSDSVLPREDVHSNYVFTAVMLIWLPFTRVATFASFLKVKTAQKMLVTHWVRVATGLDFHHFHLGAVLLLAAIAIRPFVASPWAQMAVAALTAVGLSYVLDQAVPVLVKTFGRGKGAAKHRCAACDRQTCPWRWGNRGLCYFARESTIAAAGLHALALWYVAVR